MLTSPYNFVSLNSKVYLPDWSDKVSQDIPFEDGEDGYIEVTWHNYSPLFIRNEDKNNPDPIHIDINGNRRYFIPGSSIKGMLRNTLSILAFGKMAEGEQYKDRRFSFRLDRNSAKINYKYSVRNLIESEQKPFAYQKKYDLCETIFGLIGKDNSLKGRVQFSHAWTESEITPNNPVNGVLGQPKAKYYPFYLQQDKNSLTYATYSTDGARISGRKRYRIHRSNKVKMLPQGNNNNNTTTRIKAIPEGYDFVMRINLHNMRPVEIGAILSAITFHLNKDVYHNIGCAKSFGYGKIKANNIRLKGLKYNDIRSYLALFENAMNDFCGKDWTAIPQIKKLLGIMSEHDDAQVRMMSLNEYNEGKKNANKPDDTILKEERDEDSISFTQINSINNRIKGIKQILSNDIDSITDSKELNQIKEQSEQSLELCKSLDNEVEDLLCVIDFTSLNKSNLISVREQICELNTVLNEQIEKVDARNQAKLHDDFVIRNTELYQKAEKYADSDKDIDYNDSKSLNNGKTGLETSLTTYETIVSKMTAEGLDHTEEDKKIEALKSTIAEINKRIAELKSTVTLRDILEEKMPNGQYKVKEWKTCGQKVTNYLKDHTLSKDDRTTLCATVRRLSENPSRDEIKKNTWTKRDSHIWKGVESYLGKEATDRLFDEINTK